MPTDPTDGFEDARLLVENIAGFDWYVDSRRVICTLDDGRAEKLVAVHLETGAVQELWTGPHDEIDVSPDGRFVMFASGLGHLGMGRAMFSQGEHEKSAPSLQWPVHGDQDMMPRHGMRLISNDRPYDWRATA